jgi:hypothetical protein
MADQRHPADVLADQLEDHFNTWFEWFAPSDREAVKIVVEKLRYIADPYEAND